MFYKLILETALGEIAHDNWVLQLPVTIGRNPQHGVCVNHESISRTHCQLVLNSQGALLLRDMNSTNGTYVRDRRVKQSELFPGENFQVGALLFRIEYESDTDHGRPAPVPKSFDLSATKPMITLGDAPASSPVAPSRKWWQFWR